MKNLTVNQIKKACEKFPYLQLRIYDSNKVSGINSKIAFLSRFKNLKNHETNFSSYKPISFHEYINIKGVFIF